MTFLAKRGIKRQLEAKKFKTLGELQILRTVLAKVQKRQLEPKTHNSDSSNNTTPPLKLDSTGEDGLVASVIGKARVKSSTPTNLSPLPTLETLFTELLTEYQILRSSGLSR